MVGPRYQYNLIPACSSSWKPPHKISSTFMPLKLVPGVKVLRTRPRGSIGENCYICHNKYSAVTYWQLSSIDQLYVRHSTVSLCVIFTFLLHLYIYYIYFSYFAIFYCLTSMMKWVLVLFHREEKEMLKRISDIIKII